jgi:hypothetical protein
MADIKSGQDVTSLMAGIKSGDDVTALMSADVGSSATVPEPPRGRDFKIFGVNIHVPPEDKPRLDSNIATVGGVGIAPEDALMVGQAAKGIAAATSAGGMVAGLKEAVKTANPVVKFEVSRRALKAVGVPDGVAEVIAFGVSGYRRGGKTPIPEGPVSEPGYPRAGSTPAPPPAPVEPPAHLDLSQRVPAGGLTQQQIAERLAATKAQGMNAPQVEPVMAPRPSPSSVPVPEGPPEPSIEPAKHAAPSKSPQQILNEEAIAKRRAAYQESLKADAKPVLEDVEAGKMTAEQAAAELAKRWGTPSDAERRFPPNKSGLPSNPPTARKARGKVSDLADMPIEPPKPVEPAGPSAENIASVQAATRKKFSGKIADLTEMLPATQKYAATQAGRAEVLDPEIDYALKWIEQDMEAIPFTKRTVIDHPDKGMGGARLGVGGSAGAKIYRNIVGEEGSEISGAKRGDVLKAIKNLREGKVTPVGELVLGVARDLKGMSIEKLQKLMATPPP